MSDAQFPAPTVVGTMEAPPNSESSGLAASRRTPGLLWTHDDSGGSPTIYGIDTNGKARGRITLKGAKSGDWEDTAAFTMEGKAYILVADTGDNDAVRSNVWIHLLEEPSADSLSPSSATSVQPVASIKIRYPDGPRDCESVAVDPKERAVYFLSKRDAVPRLYRLTLPSPLRSGEMSPTFVGEVRNMPQKGEKRRDGRVLSWPVAMDFSPDGTMAAVLTYTQPILFRRSPGESWAAALAKQPIILAPHKLPQAEAMAFSADGKMLLVASEKSRNLLGYPMPGGGTGALTSSFDAWMARNALTVAGVGVVLIAGSLYLASRKE